MERLLASLLIAAGVSAILFGVGWHYGGKGPKRELALVKAELALVQEEAERENARIIRAGRAAAIAAENRVREADAQAEFARSQARDMAVRLGHAMRSLTDVRRVLGDSSAGSVASSPETPSGAVREDPPADLAGGLATCEATLAATVDAFAYNRANHARCIARLEAWQEFWRRFEQSYVHSQENPR